MKKPKPKLKGTPVPNYRLDANGKLVFDTKAAEFKKPVNLRGAPAKTRYRKPSSANPKQADMSDC